MVLNTVRLDFVLRRKPVTLKLFFSTVQKNVHQTEYTIKALFDKVFQDDNNFTNR